MGKLKMKKNKKKIFQYELTTTRDIISPPHAVFGKNKVSLLRWIKKRLRRGEKIISLKRVY